MENEELFQLIGDEMYLISYMSEKWSREVANATTVKNSAISANKVSPKSNSTNNAKGK